MIPTADTALSTHCPCSSSNRLCIGTTEEEEGGVEGALLVSAVYFVITVRKACRVSPMEAEITGK